MRHATTETSDGARLACQVHGPEDGPPLLLLQGQANSHRWWEGLREPFAETYRTVTFDWRGTGRTHADTHGADWSTSSFADDAATVLDALGIARADVYGTSMGGRVGQWLALRHPSRVRKLVLACTSPGGRPAVERSQEIRRSLAHPDAAVRRRALLELMYTPAWAAEHGRGSTLLGDPTMSPAATRLHLRVSGRHDAADQLHRISTPTLVLHGADDLMAPVQNARFIADCVPDAVLQITPRGRHGFFDEFAETVTPRVLRFLTS